MLEIICKLYGYILIGVNVSLMYIFKEKLGIYCIVLTVYI